MTEKQARKLVEDYNSGWVDGDGSKILSTLSADCIIIESHGPTYHNTDEVKQWMGEWFATGKVDKWDIKTFFFIDDTVFFEWSFACTIDSKTSSIEGVSIVKFKGNKINFIHEYRMTKPAFDYIKPAE